MKLLRIDMNQLQVKWEDVPPVYEYLGGRALIVKLLLEEIPPTCDALGPHNKLIFTPGLLGGAGVSTAGRLGFLQQGHEMLIPLDSGVAVRSFLVRCPRIQHGEACFPAD